MRRSRRFPKPTSVATLAIVLVGLLLPAQASAADPITVTSQFEDPGQIIPSSATAPINEQIDAARDSGINLYVVIVDSFAGASSADQWCTQTGEKSHLASNAVIYALAARERSYAICAGPSSPVPQSQLTAAANKAAQTLRGQEVDATAVTKAVEKLRERLTSASGSSSAKTSASFSLGKLMPFIFMLVVIFVVIAFFLNKRKARSGSQTPASFGQAPVNLEQLRSDAAVALMNTEDAVHSASDDLAFARAQFGQIATQSFADAHHQAEELVRQAFEVQTQLESSSPQQQAQLCQSILGLCQQAQQLLAAHAEEFTRLRNVEANAPAAISDLRERVQEARQMVARSRSELEALQLTFSPTTLHSILDNPQAASDLLDAADSNLTAAQAALETDRAEATHRIGIAQRAFGQAMVHIEEVMSAANDLSKSEERLTQAIASITSDIRDVDRLASRDQTFGPLVEDAEGAINHAHQARRGQGDPLEALSKLRTAEDALDTALASLREADEHEKRQQERVRTDFELTDDALRRAKAYLATHRGVADGSARQFFRRAEEQRQEAHQIYQSDAAQAIELLRVAKANAERAISLTDEESQRQAQNYHSRGSGIDPWSLVLGGILLGDHGGSRGGNNWSSGGFGGNFSGGGFGGSFGGGGWSSGGSGTF